MKTLGIAVHDWMEGYKMNSVKPATYDRLVTSYNLMAKYPIFWIPIDELTTSNIQSYINALVAKGYALSTIKKQYNLLSEFIEHENLSGEIVKPLHKGVKLPVESAVKKRRKEVVAYTRSEQTKLLRILERGDSPAWFAAILMLETGLRVGEALALTWSDIDWHRRALHVHKTFIRLGNSRLSFIQNEAKSFSSNRTIPLSTKAYALLERMHENVEDDESLIFHNSRGNKLTYECLRWWIQQACYEANVPYYGQHVFRHTFATNCYERGCDVKLLSKLLGHLNVTITYNVYIHLFGDALEEMRSVLG